MIDGHKILKEVAPGCDEQFYKNEGIVKEFYSRATKDSKETESLRKKVEETKQKIRDHQLKNMLLEEQIDEIIDKQIVTRIDKRNDEKKIGRILR